MTDGEWLVTSSADTRGAEIPFVISPQMLTAGFHVDLDVLLEPLVRIEHASLLTTYQTVSPG